MQDKTTSPIHVVGGGLAGSEAAWQIAQSGVPVILHEMRGVRGTDAHKGDTLAELVCSNSFRSDDATANAVVRRPMRSASSMPKCGLPVLSSWPAPTGTRCRPAAHSPSIATGFPRP